ncbi:fadB [Symbiodinium sp. CCMP2592]|nr:fadB [Symbiodinium sp. CCMP2592]
MRYHCGFEGVNYMQSRFHTENDFNRWIQGKVRQGGTPGGHFITMTDYLDADPNVTQHIVRYENLNADLRFVLGLYNITFERLRHDNGGGKRIFRRGNVSNETLAYIRAYYAADFVNFGYPYSLRLLNQFFIGVCDNPAQAKPAEPEAPSMEFLQTLRSITGALHTFDEAKKFVGLVGVAALLLGVSAVAAKDSSSRDTHIGLSSFRRLGSEILVQALQDFPCLWILVDLWNTSFVVVDVQEYEELRAEARTAPMLRKTCRELRRDWTDADKLEKQLHVRRIVQRALMRLDAQAECGSGTTSHQCPDEAEVESDTTECLDQPLDQQTQEEEAGRVSAPSPSELDSDNGSTKELPHPAPCHGSAREVVMKDGEQPNKEEDLPGALRAEMGEVHEGTSSQIEMQEKKRKRGASMDSKGAHGPESDAQKAQATMDPLHKSFETLSVLLQYLSVTDILAWRQTSLENRSPKVLLQHVANLCPCSLDTTDLLVAYSEHMNRPAGSTSISEAMDVDRQKSFQCQDWCRTLARAATVHSFDEEDVRKIICQHLQSVFRLSTINPGGDAFNAAHHLIAEYGAGGLPCAQELIAEAMLSRMRHMISTKEQFWVSWPQMLCCMEHLESVLRSLTKPQRQEWVSLLVTGLHRVECRFESFEQAKKASAAEYFNEKQKRVLEDLVLLWCVDDDPGQTYHEVKPQLLAWQRSRAFQDVRNSLVFLLRS